jgi:hypothetical protein
VRNGAPLNSVKISEIGLGGTQFPATYAIISNGDPNALVHLRIFTGLGAVGQTSVGDPVNLSEADVVVPTDRLALLRVPITWLCAHQAYDKGGSDHYVENHCPEGTTCVGGQCIGWAVDSASLPAYSDGAVFGDGSCFDTLGCFATGTSVPLDPATCTIAAPPAGVGINVAIVSDKGQGGVCANGASECLVPLDADLATGWHDNGAGRLGLPAGVCNPINATRAVRAVAVTTSCATKTPSVPTCGLWSSVGSGGTLNAPLPSGVSEAGAD